MANYRPKYVSFDCYGTLINFEIASVTKRIVGDQVADQDWPVFLRSFSKYRYDQVLGGYYPYQEVLQDAFDRVCRKWNIGSDPTAGQQFAEAVLSWGPHSDIPEPLGRMAARYPLRGGAHRRSRSLTLFADQQKEDPR